MITAVLVAYWKEREKNIPKIIESLNEGSVKPDKILIFSNNRNLAIPDERSYVIQSGHNFGHRARFIAALLYPSDYYYFIDDDMSPKPETLSNFMKYASDDCCLTYFGRRKDVHERFRSSIIDIPKVVDWAEGVGSIFCSFQALVKSLELEILLRKHKVDYEREADIVLSMANITRVIPSDKNSELVDIGQRGVGMYKQENHVWKRKQLVDKIYELRGGEA